MTLPTDPLLRAEMDPSEVMSDPLLRAEMDSTDPLIGAEMGSVFLTIPYSDLLPKNKDVHIWFLLLLATSLIGNIGLLTRDDLAQHHHTIAIHESHT